ncbi:reverse transcriptase domain-containing protein [Tanacetum coccineum]
MVEGEPFNTEHKLNEYNHVKPIKQNKRRLGPDRNMAACKETEELTKAGILRKVKNQTWVANLVMVKRRNKGWTLIYFVSRVLQGAELNYPALEKLVLALVHAARRLRRYFQAHMIMEVPDSNSKWRLYTGGASNSGGSGAGLMLINPKGKEYTYALRFEFETTNNEAEYEALLAGLWIAQEMEIAKVEIFLDS